jgi:hypothetical protein
MSLEKDTNGLHRVSIPLPGEHYAHYKGGKYVILLLSRHTETGETLVTYRHLTYQTVWTRPLSEFLKPVDDRGPSDTRRFARLGK